MLLHSWPLDRRRVPLARDFPLIPVERIGNRKDGWSSRDAAGVIDASHSKPVTATRSLTGAGRSQQPQQRIDTAGFALPRGFSTRAIVSWQRTHGGLRFPIEVNVPEIPERLTEYHRMLRDNYLHTGGGLSYSRGLWDIAGSVLLTARGSNSHDVRVFSVTVSRLFEIGP